MPRRSATGRSKRKVAGKHAPTRPQQRPEAGGPGDDEALLAAAIAANQHRGPGPASPPPALPRHKDPAWAAKRATILREARQRRTATELPDTVDFNGARMSLRTLKAALKDKFAAVEPAMLQAYRTGRDLASVLASRCNTDAMDMDAAMQLAAQNPELMRAQLESVLLNPDAGAPEGAPDDMLAQLTQGHADQRAAKVKAKEARRRLKGGAKRRAKALTGGAAAAAPPLDEVETLLEGEAGEVRRGIVSGMAADLRQLRRDLVRGGAADQRRGEGGAEKEEKEEEKEEEEEELTALAPLPPPSAGLPCIDPLMAAAGAEEALWLGL